jgi:putative ABC transport system ATP-binding protein
MAILQLHEVSKSRLAKDGTPVIILHRLSLEVQPQQLTLIIGPSGGGKTTLVRLLNRLEDPTSGRILLHGRALGDYDPLELRCRVGLVAQKPFMFDGTVLENLQISYVLRHQDPPSAEHPMLRQALDFCRLPQALLSRQARSLSLGQQQRVSLARTLITSPEVIVLDEPTSALDRPTGDQLADTLQDICRSGGKAVVMVSHDLRLAERVADHLAYLEAGSIIEEGSARQLLSTPRSAELQRFLAQPAASGGIHE